MWWAGSSVVDAYLGTQAIVMARGRTVLATAVVAGLEDGLARLQAALTDCRARTTLRLWLSGGLCQPFLPPLAAGLATPAELLRLAQAMAADGTSLGGNCQVWVDDRHGTGRALAVAVQQRTLALIFERLGSIARIRSIRPWWAEALRVRLLDSEPTDLVGVRDCDSLTVLGGVESDFSVAFTMAPVLDDATADAAWQRAEFGREVPAIAPWRVRLVADDSCVEGLPSCALGVRAEAQP